MNQQDTQATTHEPAIKDAAKRMCKQLSGKGIKVTHTAMLEAIAIGFGLDNWRTLKAVIDAPRAVPEQPLPPEGVMQTWLVEAVYDDNDQPYSDDVEARTSLEAAYILMAKLLAEQGDVMHIAGVMTSRHEHRLGVDSLSQYDMALNDKVVRELLREVFRIVKEKGGWPSEQLRAAAQWAYNMVDGELEDPVVKWSEPVPNPLEYWTDYWDMEKMDVEPQRLEAGFFPSEALTMLCSFVEEEHGGVMALEKKDDLAMVVHQVAATAKWFSKLLDHVDTGLADEDYDDYPLPV